MQRKKFTKCTAALLALLLSLGILSGCTDSSAKDDKETTTGTTQKKDSRESSAATEDGTEVSKEENAKPSGAATVLKVEVFDRAITGGSDPTNNFWTKWINEQMIERHNIEVQFVSIPRTEEIPQLNVMMAGGNAPDIAFTYSANVVYNYYKQDGVADLTDFIGANAPTLKAYLGEEILAYGQFDGKQYMIPAKRISRSMYSTFIRKDWLDALNLEIPETREEFYDALVEFKEKNPGNVEQVIPYVMASDIPWHIGTITDSFIDPNMNEEDAFVRGISATSSATTLLYPGFKEGIAFVNKMFNAGLIDSQFPMYKDFSPAGDQIKRGVVGAFTSNYDYPIRTADAVYNTLKENVPEAELVAIDTFENANGDKVKQMYAPTGIYSFVPASSPNVEAAVKYLDFLCEDEVRTFLTIGEEDVNHTKDANGIPVMINLENDDRMMNAPNNLDYAVIVNGVDLGKEEENIMVLSKSYEAGYEEFFMNSYKISMHDAVVFNPDVTLFEAEAQFSTSLNDKRKEILANAIMASEADFDKVYDQGVEEWLASGGQQCLDERQAYWDEYKG